MTVIARRPVRYEPNRPDLRGVSLIRLSIRSYDFAKPPRLTAIFLTWADLRRADLRGAVLQSSIVNFADLSRAWLSNADLRYAAFNNSVLRGAAMEGALLQGASFRSADLRDVSGLTAAQLAEAIIDDKTKLSEDLANDPWVQARISDCLAWRSRLSREKLSRAWFPLPTPAPAITEKELRTNGEKEHSDPLHES
ncbi:pentapeptide repeat-containing protein [Sphaerimonospora cavernae]|uniref:Pentapeptide repeat-containing protein n=2 Tax=Sphaerimonospora cavernae TaxID=1740611 RepID=A0ABV6UDV8_9ACTN